MNYSIISFDKVKSSSISLRLDAEYYKSDYLKAEYQVKKKNYQELRNLVSVLTDYHANGSYEILRNNVKLLDSLNYALMIRTVDFENDDFENDVKYISKHAYDFLKKTQIFGKEIIINKIGNPGKVYIVPPLNRKISLGMNQFMIRPNKKINAGYLYVYLVSSYGCDLLQQRITGAVPLSIDKESVRSVIVPILDDEFQKKIDMLLTIHLDSKLKSKELYAQAEKILLSELNLLNWEPKHQLFFIKNYSETQLVSRVDAEYFQPMYEQIIKAVTSFKHYDCLSNIVTIKKCIEPGSEAYRDDGILFLRVSNLSKFGIKDGNQQYLDEESYNQLGQHQPKKGEILLSKDATPGIAYYLNNEPEKMIPSGGIIRLKVSDTEKICPEYLTLVLSSEIVQKQIKRDAGGSIINHWLVDQVKKTLIPILPIAKQKKITETINNSFYNRELSKQLLDIAKSGVELAIEKNEKESKLWISKELRRFNIKM